MAETPNSGSPKLEIPTDPLTGSPETRPALAVANSIEQKARERGELPPFIPVKKGEDDFVPPQYLVPGSPESEQAYQNIISEKNPLGAQIRRKINFAIADKANYDKKLSEWKEGQIARAKTPSVLPGGITFDDGIPMPKLHPKTAFLSNFGKTDKEALINLAKAQVRAQFYANRYEQDGIGKLIASDDSLLEAPEALADAMSKTGKFFKTKEEEEFFRSTSQNKGAIEYDTSPFRLVQKNHIEKWSGSVHPSQLEAQARLTGWQLNPDNPKDMKMFRDWRKWNEEHPDTKGVIDTFGDNSVHALKTLTDAIVSTGYNSIKSIGDPEIGWNPNFKDEKAKAAYTEKLLKLISAKENGDVLKGFTEDTALRMVEKEFAVSGKVNWDYLDENLHKEIPQLVIEIAKETKELDAKGAFTAKKQGITQLATLASSIVTGTIGMAGMGIDTAPERWWSKGLAGISTVTTGAGDILSDIVGDKSKNIPFWERFEREEVKRFNSGIQYSRWHHHLSENGLFGSSVTDTRWHKDASMFLTAAEGAGIVKAGVSTVKGGLRYAGLKTGSKAYASFMENTGVQASREAMNVELRKLADMGVDFTSATETTEIRRVIEEIKEAAKTENAGKGIDDYEAIERAFDGRGKIKNPANPNELIEVPRTTLNKLSQNISDKAAGVQTVRDAIAKAAWGGRTIRYSEESMTTLQKARKLLKEAYPDVNVDALTDDVIYDRMRRSDFPVGKGEAAINKNELNAIQKEVGNVWKAIDKTGIAGYKRAMTGPIQIDYLHSNHLFRASTGALKKLGQFGEWVEELSTVHGVPTGGVVATSKLSSGPGVTVSTLNETGNISAGLVGVFKYMTPLLKAAGAVGEMGDFLMEFKSMNKVQLGNEFDSTLLAMQNKYNRDMRKLLIEKASIKPADWPSIQKELAELGETTVTEQPHTTATSVNVEKEIARIEKEYQHLQQKTKWADLLHTMSANGALGGTVKMFYDGSVGAATNEAFFGIFSGTQGIGSGTGFSMFGTGVNSISSGWVTHFTKNKKLQERMSYDMDEIRARISENVGVEGDAQAMHIYKILAKAKDNSEVIRQKDGNEAAETYLAREIFTMANLFRTNAKIEFTNQGTRHGLVALMESLNMQDPEYADAVRNQYMSVAVKQGLSNEGAIQYANQMIEQHIRNNAAIVRRGSINKEYSILEAQKQKLLETTTTEIDALTKAGEILAKEAGMSPDKLFSADERPKAGDVFKPEAYPTPIPVPPNASPLMKKQIEQANLDKIAEIDNRNKINEARHKEQIDTNLTVGGVPMAGLPKTVVDRLKTYREEFRRIKELQKKNNLQVTEITKKMSDLKDESDNLSKSNPVAEYRDGQISVAPDGSSLTSFKNGITVWERDGTVRVYLDHEKFSTADAREEIAHALFYTENMRDSRAYLRNIIFGQYEVNANGQRVLVKGPLIGKDVNESIKMMDMFIDAHAETLGEGEAAFFRARWEKGKKNMAKNPDDTRLLQAGLIEFAGKLYQARMELANPQFGRTGQQGSSSTGSWEAGNITIPQELNTAQAQKMSWFFGPNASVGGKLSPKARLLWKLVTGDLTINDIANDGNPINATDIDFTGQRPNPLTESVRVAAKFLKIFKVNGAYDGMMIEMTRDKLIDLGFVKDEQRSTPDLTFFQTGKIRNPQTGEINDIDPVSARWAEQMIAHTRNRGGKIDTHDIFDTQSVFSRENDQSDAAKNQRWQWALASGRAHFINPETMMFKKSLDKLMHDEWQPLGSLVDRVITPRIGDDGDWSGMKVKKTVDGRTVLIGAPNVQQTKRILEHLKTEYSKFSEGNQSVMENIGIFMQAIADGNMFDPAASKSGAQGWTQVFMGEYEGATQGVGEGTAKRTKQTNVQQRMLVPMRLVIRPSGLDISGKKYEDGDVYDHIYVECLDMVALGKSTRNGWNNLIFDETGVPYWGTKKKNYTDGKDQIQSLFRGKISNLNNAIELVLQNYQQGGSVTRATGPTAVRPPNESWEVLLPLAGGNPGEAKLMASAVNRILGFTRSDFVELNGLEQQKVLTAAQEKRRDDLREKFDEENENDKGVTPLEGVSSAEKKLARLYGEHPNSLGGERMRDTQNPFSLFRIDRFQGTVVPHEGPNGPLKVRFNQFTQGWGSANYSSKNWVQMTTEDLGSNKKMFNMQGQDLTEGYLHKSGYSIFRTEKTTKGGKRPDGSFAPDTTRSEYVVFDPTRGLAGRGFQNKELAFDFASNHSTTIDLPPERLNILELALKDEGWLPKGINFKGTIRDTFVSKDGKWQAERKVYQGQSSYQLVDINSGIVIMKGIKVGFKADGTTPHVKDLNAAIKAAEEGGMVELAVSEKYEADLKEWKSPLGYTGLASYYKISGETGAPEKKLLAAKNPIYYEFRKRFAQTLGWEAVNAITDTMRKELGDDVVNTNHQAVSDWVTNWTSEWSIKKLKEITESASDEAKFEINQLLDDQRAVDRLNLGQEWAWNRPKKPKKIGQTASQEQRDAYEQAQKDYLEEAIQWDKQNRAIREKPISEKDVSNMLQYAKSMKSRQAEFEAIVQVLGGLSQQQQRLQEGRQVSGKLAEVRNAIQESLTTAQSTFFVNNGGIIIQQLMPKAQKPFLGLEISERPLISQQAGSLDIFGKRVLGKGEPTDIRNANYIIFGHGGNVIARAKTQEEAAELADRATREAMWMKKFVAEGADGASGYGGPQKLPPEMREPLPPEVFPKNRYNKPAPR